MSAFRILPRSLHVPDAWRAAGARAATPRTILLSVLCVFVLLLLATPAYGITVAWKGSNVSVLTGLEFAEIEFEDPLSGAEAMRGWRILDWRDADYRPGQPLPYEDWSRAGAGVIDGNASEVWMRQAGQAMTTTTTVMSTAVSIHLTGDDNDGVADVLVDGVLVAKLNMGGPQPPQRCAVIVSPLPLGTHAIEVRDMGIQPDGAWGDDVALNGAAALARDAKWTQRPDRAAPSDVFYGWNETSVYGRVIAADDWRCDTPDPVADIHWWGSYPGWTQAYPQARPTFFHFAIWTDVPEGADPPFSHPGHVIWEYMTQDFTELFAGWDFDPRTEEYESCFAYACTLPQEAWFYQNPAGENQVYWLSIAAVYVDGPTDVSWGWKTRPRDIESPAPDAAVRTYIPNMPHVGEMWVSGDPLILPSTTEPAEWDLAFELTSVRPGPGEDFKWLQPPTTNPQNPQPCFWGFDQISLHEFPPYAADDWVCVDSRPIRDIEWWGSYLGWMDVAPPPSRPLGWMISIWTDVPAGIDRPFSHPGNVIWQWFARADAVTEEYVGCDFVPGLPNLPESCFRYHWDIPEPEWFMQPGQHAVFWISIAALMPPPCPCNGDFNGDGMVTVIDLNQMAFCMGQPPIGPCAQADLNCDGVIDPLDMNIFTCQFQRGWPDPACCPLTQVIPWGWKTRTRDPLSPAPDSALLVFAPPAPSPGMPFMDGEPIFGPTTQDVWDMAFGLSTHDWLPIVKWSQPPEPYEPNDAINGWDEMSWTGSPQIVADDFACLDDDPITNVHWWGSHLGWGHREPPYVPQSFWISIWTDVPAGIDQPFSHPGQVVWTYQCTDYRWSFVGWDFDPRNSLAGIPNPPEACFLYECELPEWAWFFQDEESTIYWISISAFDPALPSPAYPWGWKTRPRMGETPAPDAAVVIWSPTWPLMGAQWQAGAYLWFPQPADLWDMCFVLTTEPQAGDTLEPKWTQRPHPPQLGADLASNIWLPGPGPVQPKWGQDPDPHLAGLHDTAPTVLADDWICRGGQVVDLHWWGNYEMDDAGAERRGGGVAAVRLSIHDDQLMPPYSLPGAVRWATVTPFTSISEIPTGVRNLEGSMIYEYSYVLPTPFAQTTGMRYWFDVSFIPLMTADPPMWRWQEAARATPSAMNMPAASNSGAGWSSIIWPGGDASQLAFMITSDLTLVEPVNKTVADDFISDGRDILALRWWGSYFDDRYAPGVGVDAVHQLDGWLLTFHWADVNQQPAFPPDLLLDGHPTTLAIYFAPRDAVSIRRLRGTDCLSHTLYRYEVSLADCCLLCGEADPRMPAAIPTPGEIGAFQERRGVHYWVTIDAVVGAEWLPPLCGRLQTGHLPPISGDIALDYWGWHSGIEPVIMPPSPLRPAAVGAILDFSPPAPQCWDFGRWAAIPWPCPQGPLPPRIDLAYELLASPCPEDLNGDGMVGLTDLSILLARYGSCHGQAAYLPSADFDNDGCVNLQDLARLLSVYGSDCDDVYP